MSDETNFSQFESPEPLPKKKKKRKSKEEDGEKSPNQFAVAFRRLSGFIFLQLLWLLPASSSFLDMFLKTGTS